MDNKAISEEKINSSDPILILKKGFKDITDELPFTLSARTSTVLQDWQGLKEFSKAKEQLKIGTANVFSRDYESFKVFMENIKDTAPELINSVETMSRVLALETAASRLYELCNHKNSNESEITNAAEALHAAHVNLIFQINSNLEKEAQNIAHPNSL